MTTPLVTVCLPNLNTRRYLPERIDSILAQTYHNWELVISDNYSVDGAWELFQELASTDSRVAIEQAPREGMYANWNRCIARARGEFVYIATSDDTMAPDCLEKMVAALTAHPECEIAHCPLLQIDSDGRALPDWWSKGSMFALSSGPSLNRRHVRRAPLDGLLHLHGGTVYTSITQLLIRRSLFDRIGLFDSRWGSVGDFNWGMRAGLVANTVHVPGTWGGWRVHGDQATASVHMSSESHAQVVDEMIDHAVDAAGPLMTPAVHARLTERWTRQSKEMRAFARQVAARACLSFPRRVGYTVGSVLCGSMPAFQYVIARLRGQSFHDWAVERLREVGQGARHVLILAAMPEWVTLLAVL
jgi:Glycosyl transferase family 2